MNCLDLSSEGSVGFTAVSDLFIENFVPSASGEFVKIYLYLLHLYAAKNPNISVASLADIFEQTEGDVMRALKYWDDKGVLSLSFDSEQQLNGIKFNSIPCTNENRRDSIRFVETYDNYSSQRNNFNVDERMPSNVLSINRNQRERTFAASRINVSKKKLDELSSNDEFCQLLYVVQTYIGRTLKDGEVDNIVFFYDELHFPSDLIEYLFEYCVQKGKVDFRYITSVALAWADEDIITVEAAKEQVSNHSNAVVYQIMRAFGLNNREPGTHEKEFITKWTDVYCFDADIIIEACSRTLKATHQPSFEYADSILSKWNSSNIRSAEDIKKADAEYEASKPIRDSKNSNVIKQSANRFNNFQQHPKKSDDWYNTLLSNNN